MVKFILKIFVILLYCNSISGNTIDSLKLKFTSYSFNEGIFDKDIFDFAEFDNYIWVHTGRNIYRLVGSKFEQIKIVDTENNNKEWRTSFTSVGNSLISLNRRGTFIYNKELNIFKPLQYTKKRIRQIRSLSNDSCLIATSNGAFIAELNGDSLIEKSIIPETSGKFIHHVNIVDSTIFVAYNKVINSYTINSGKITFNASYNVGYSVDIATQLCNGEIWAGTPRNGLLVKGLNDKSFIPIEKKLNLNYKISSFIRGIYQKGNNIWVTTFEGIYIFNTNNKSIKWVGKPYTDGNSIFGLMFDKSGNIWIGGRSTGVNVHYNHNNIFKIKGNWQNEVQKIKVSTFCEDFEGNYWIGTIEEPILYKYSNLTKSLTLFDKSTSGWDTLVDSQVKIIYSSPRGKLWCGTDEKGLFLYDKTNNSFKNVISDNRFTKNHSAIEFLKEDRNGNLLIGRYTGGIILANISDINNISLNRLHGGAVTDMKSDKYRNIWTSTYRDVFFFNGDSLENKFSINDSLMISCISVNDSLLSIGTQERGTVLYNLNTNKSEIIKNPQQEYNRTISTEFINSRLWITSIGGLTVYNLNTKSSVNYKSNTSHGCGQYSNRVSYIDNDSLIWYGGEKGLQLVDTKNFTEPELLFVHLKPDSEYLNSSDSIYVYNKQDVTFHIQTSNYDKNLEVKYEYSLGEDKWYKCGNRLNFVNNIDGIQYVKVRASVNGVDFIYSEKLKFRFKKSKTIYPYIILFILISVIIYILFKKGDKKSTESQEISAKKASNGALDALSIKQSDIKESDIKFIEELADILEKNFKDTSFDIKQFETHMNMGHATFYRRVKQVTNDTAGNLIKRFRLNKSKKLLLLKKNVSEAAYEVGFNDPKYFGRCFKAEFGITPSEFINNSMK